jgi:cytochrome c553
MKRSVGTLILGMLTAVVVLVAQRPSAPDFAYGYLKPLGPGDPVAPPCAATATPFPDCAYAAAPPADDGVKRELPGAASKFTRTEIYFDFGPADWYPGDHPPMPDIVAHGKKASGIRACALCHFPNGQGKMENGGVAGLPAAYVLQQLNAFQNRRAPQCRSAQGKYE